MMVVPSYGLLQTHVRTNLATLAYYMFQIESPAIELDFQKKNFLLRIIPFAFNRNAVCQLNVT